MLRFFSPPLAARSAPAGFLKPGTSSCLPDAMADSKTRRQTLPAVVCGSAKWGGVGHPLCRSFFKDTVASPAQTCLPARLCRGFVLLTLRGDNPSAAPKSPKSLENASPAGAKSPLPPVE